jgi:hypothetical protein
MLIQIQPNLSLYLTSIVTHELLDILFGLQEELSFREFLLTLILALQGLSRFLCPPHHSLAFMPIFSRCSSLTNSKTCLMSPINSLSIWDIFTKIAEFLKKFLYKTYFLSEQKSESFPDKFSANVFANSSFIQFVVI